MNHIRKVIALIALFVVTVTATAQQTPLKNGLLQGTLNGTPSGGTVDLSANTVTFTSPLAKTSVRINNPANTFSYSLTPAAIAANRQLNLPLITGTDTLASLGLAQTWTGVQTFTAPVLGTVASGSILTNATGLPISTGVSGLGTGIATFLATPSSANLATAVTGDTGSGALVFATSPTLVTPILGTPTSGDLTNCTGIDFLRTLANSEVSVTAATTLNSTAFGKMHLCSGTTANYTVDLPAASGNAGKIIGFRMSSALTKLITIDANASELIDGETVRILWAQETAILMCDGTGWTKIMGRTRPLAASGIGTSGTSMTTSTATKIGLQTLGAESVSGTLSTANSRIIAPRKSNYSVSALTTYEVSSFDASGKEAYCQIYKNGTVVSGPAILFSCTISTTGGNSYAAPAVSSTIALNAGDYVENWGIHTAGTTMVSRTAAAQVMPHLTVIEIPSW